jgi:excisionase family DNA binding protein
LRSISSAPSLPDWASEAGHFWSKESAHDSPHRSFDNRPIFSATRPDYLLTVADVASRLSVSTKTIRRMIARGELAVVRIGRSIRIDPEVIEKIVRQNE